MIIMCSIMYTNSIKRELVEKEFLKIRHRGPDMSRVLNDDMGLWGFHRLAIMGPDEKGMQPFTDGDYKVICNGEIYNYKELKEELEYDGYTFVSGSDCEILIPLYKKYGISMFDKLDAEYALVLTDGKSIIATRDQIGIRSLFYGYDKDKNIYFASEVKALHSLCTEIKPFPIGSYYKDGSFETYEKIYEVKEYVEDDLDTIFKKINEKLSKGIIKRLTADVPVGLLLSGGLDSSLVCAIASKHLDRKIRTFAIGMNEDAIDLKYAKIVAEYIGSEHSEVIITRQDVIDAIDEVIYALETFDITTIRASIGMFLLCKHIRDNTDIRVLLTGEISDELFGYKYTDFAPNKEEFQKESEQRIEELYMYDVLRADRCISYNSLEGRVPFGDIDFVRYVLSIDPAKKMNIYNKGKYLLRKSFEKDYLPDEILYREKAAFSDAVGHSLVDCIKEYAEDLYTEEDFKEKIKKYAYHCPPFTKESLLYREIFERHYNGRAKLIKDYWMPNRDWEGCNVTDPSARVLSNYGDSGK